MSEIKSPKREVNRYISVQENGISKISLLEQLAVYSMKPHAASLNQVAKNLGNHELIKVCLLLFDGDDFYLRDVIIP